MNRSRIPSARGAPAVPRALLLVLVLLIAACPRAAMAFRPFDSTDAAVAAPREFEIEVGPLGYLAEDGSQSLVAPEIRLNWGFAPRSEVVLEGRNFVPRDRAPGEPRDRIEETGLSLKSVLRPGQLQGGSGPLDVNLNGVYALTQAVLPHMIERGGGTIVTVSSVAALRPGLIGGAILEGPYAWRVRPAAEIEIQGERDGPTQRSALAGAIWAAREGLAFDLAYRIAREGERTTREVRAGLTWGFPLKRR